MAGKRLFCLDDLLEEMEGNMDDNCLWFCQVITRLTRKILVRHNHHPDKEKGGKGVCLVVFFFFLLSVNLHGRRNTK